MTYFKIISNVFLRLLFQNLWHCNSIERAIGLKTRTDLGYVNGLSLIGGLGPR